MATSDSQPADDQRGRGRKHVANHWGLGGKIDFVIIDPPGCAPIFASLTAGSPKEHRRAMALRSTFVAALILYMFAVFGEAFLGALGISLDAFRVAGGIMPGTAPGSGWAPMGGATPGIAGAGCAIGADSA